MLRPIPVSMLKDSAVFKVCTGIDAWQNPTWDEYTVKNVHIQDTNEVKKNRENKEVVLRSVLYVDSRLSTPSLDYRFLAEQSEKAGEQMRCTVFDAQGETIGSFEIETVDIIPNVPATTVHHYELGLV